MKNNIYKEIYHLIKKHSTIVLTRHISVDPDAMGSCCGLRDAIKLTFPEKNVYAVGTGTIRFDYMGKLDKGIDFSSMDDILMIALDTPDKKRVDMGELENYSESIKIDHHPYIETFCDLEWVDDHKSSACEMVCELIKNTKLKMNQKIAETLFIGMVADTNRFLFQNADENTFQTASLLLKNYNIDITKCYQNLYHRPFSEMQLLGYMASNMKVTEHGVGYVKISNDIINKLQIDTVSSGGLINEFNYIDEFMVWLTATEDVKNGYIRVSIRSRGPVINKTAENYHGGGHKLASGARIATFDEVDDLIHDLDYVCKKYIESEVQNEDSKCLFSSKCSKT